MSATMTSTLSIVQQTSSILLPPLPSELERVVRFDSECILIPEPSKRSKSTKTYTLPLWKKRTNDAEADLTGSSSHGPPSPEATHVVFKLPIPSRGRSTSSSPPTPKPLSPCLVHRHPSSLQSTMPKPIRRSSLPLTTCSIPKHDALTVPLRPCCAACVTITEESFEEGEEYQEKFSRGARRRRSASLDNSDNFGLDVARSGSIHNPGGFAAQLDLSPGARYRPSTFSLKVDEVDKRRKSQEFTEEEVMRYRSASPRSSPVFHSPSGYAATSYPLSYRPAEKDTSISSTSSSASATSDLDVPPRRPKSSPIQEEDEDQLFPLPSPRRSPNASPASSIAPSPSPSPSASTSNLAPPSNGLKSGSDELLVKSLGRKSSSTGLQPSALTLTIPEILTLERTRSSTSPVATSPKPNLSIDTKAHARSNSVPVHPLPSPPAVPAPASPVELRGRAMPTPASPKSPRSPTMSPRPKPRRPSFSLPAIKDAIKGASADVLKGVSSMSGGGVTGM
ncbi:hypothetical protein DXG01_009123 [Tephrocybe rancida]|nr:hypothetical protein DXG01_009123 [Tephrocybe rancida]